MRTHPLGIIASVAALLVGCNHARPVRLVAGVRDTIIINSTRVQPLPLTAYDRAGRRVATPRVSVQRVSGDVISVSSSGEVQCTKSGDATIRITAARLSTHAVLYCRPMRGFVFENRNYGLYVGGPPRRIEATGQGIDGRPVTLLAARIQVRDSSIASVVDGMVLPKRAGSTSIEVYAGDDRTTYSVQVVEPVPNVASLRPNAVFVERVALGRGDVRSYPLPAGRYEILFIPDAALAGAGILLAAPNANCARYQDGTPHLSCVAGDGASLVAGVAETSPARQAVSGRLVVRRLGESPNGRDYWFDAAAYPAASRSAR